jgi:hypothetical protein
LSAIAEIAFTVSGPIDRSLLIWLMEFMWSHEVMWSRPMK